jgi:hypothetical protein
MTDSSSRLTARALELVREEYEAAASIHALGIDRLNRVRPLQIQYEDIGDVDREHLAAAGAVARFAVRLGLVTSDQVEELMLDFFDRHPELRADKDSWSC